MLPRIPIAAGNQDEEARQDTERVGDRSERETGDEIAARRDQEREETRSDSGEVRAQQRDESRDGTARESKHCELGGSDTCNNLDLQPHEAHAEHNRVPDGLDHRIRLMESHRRRRTKR